MPIKYTPAPSSSAATTVTVTDKLNVFLFMCTDNTADVVVAPPPRCSGASCILKANFETSFSLDRFKG